MCPIVSSGYDVWWLLIVGFVQAETSATRHEFMEKCKKTAVLQDSDRGWL